ncbi:MAG: SMC family ATPase [Candidatus Methanoperedens sp.]|nr:SMC family ATPase [Candidatus Methanoperedens sp.]MCZ7396779.1 SMC family ATPase [Candidatus Methanoperedens sp.]
MLIKSVELKNIKSYRHATIEFKEGINGISGQNGHGKTTILEAIGYVLFDYLPYKDADFLRRGEKSGMVSVEVLANNLTYILTRKLGGEYSVRGENLHITGKKDVLSWLISSIFPVSTEDELPRIFENTIGVPQGMLTAAFMDTPTKRRKTFDEMLKVDEYRNAYENLRNTMILIDESVRSIENDIRELRIRTENYEQKKIERDELGKTIESIKKILKECSETLKVAKGRRDALKKQKDAMDKLENEIKQGRIKLEGLKQLLEKSKDELKKSEEAQKIVSALLADKERYEEERKKQEKLEGMRKERDVLKDRLNGIKNELAGLNEKRMRLEALKAEIEKNACEKTALIPLLEKQDELEEKLENVKGEHAVALNEIKDIKGRMSIAGTENLCPVIKGIRCSTVADFSSYFREQLAEAQKRLGASEDTLKAMNSELNVLGDPRSKMKALELLAKKGAQDIEKISGEIEKISEKESEASLLKTALERYLSLDMDASEVKKKLTELEPLYQRYVQNQPLAAKSVEYRNECEKLGKTIVEDDNRLVQSQKLYDGMALGFSAKALEGAEHECVELGAKVRGFEVEIKEKDRQFLKLDKEIAEMMSYLTKIGEFEAKLENEKRFGDFAKFIRETLRDSAQHIVLELISEISEEANSLYCAIMDDFSQELRWSEDYGILITESGEEKNFQQLSGGEKMGAALALRLALLKMLSNSDFVFLDEPTQNMDEIRRENLSEQIMNIKGFKQIFVISHDDTFNEKYGHVVKIEKINGESRVIHEKL